MRHPKIKRLDWLVTLSCLAMLGYFAWQGYYSPSGFSYLAKQNETLTQLKTEATRLKSNRLAMDARVGLLRPESLDPDMLDELARNELGLAGRNDVIVSLDTKISQ
jgi:cell division protein FtsB